MKDFPAPVLSHALLAAVVLTALVPAPAAAELGAPTASVATDSARIGARRVSASHGAYQRHDLTRPNGGAVHEFTAGGHVFAVSWSGPGKPDLRALLGSRFARFQAAGASRPASGRPMRALRQPVQVADSDLRIATGGHMGFFHGIAFVPSLAPAGFDAADLSVAP